MSPGGGGGSGDGGGGGPGGGGGVTPDLVATVAPAAAQSTAVGREIHRLGIFGRRLYPAFGDYGANTGPIDLVSLDLDTHVLGASELSAHTEQTWTMRMLDGALHVPYVDPRGSGDPSQGQLATSSGGGVWGVVTSVDPIPGHVFDVAKTSDGLWLFGAAGDNGTIWRSTDGGTSWAQSLSVPGSGGPARIYAAAQFGADLIAYFNDVPASGPQIDRAYRWAAGGSSWSEITSPGKVTDTLAAFSHAGTAFWLGGAVAKDLGQVTGNIPTVLVQPVDAAQQATIAATLPDIGVYDAATDGTSLYLLGSNLHVWRGDTTGTWVDLLTLTDSTVRSIAVDPPGGHLYFGTTDSRILATPIPA